MKKAKQLVKKKATQLNDGLKAKDARCQQKIESIRICSQQMSNAKDEQYNNQLKRVEKKCAKKLQKKEEQCKAKISGLKKRHAGEVDKLERQVKRLKSMLEQRNISIDALKEKVQFYRGVAYETRSESIENKLMAQLTEKEVQTITADAKASRKKAMYEAKLAKSKAEKGEIERKL